MKNMIEIFERSIELLKLDTGGKNAPNDHVRLGLCLMAGLFAFAILERVLSSTSEAAGGDDSDVLEQPEADESAHDSDTQNNNSIGTDNDGSNKKKKPVAVKQSSWSLFRGLSSKQVGWLRRISSSGRRYVDPCANQIFVGLATRQ